MPRNGRTVRLSDGIAPWARVAKTDFHRGLRDARRLYTTPLRWQAREWGACTASFLVVALAFLTDETIRTVVTNLRGALPDALAGFGHWIGSGRATLYLFVSLYLLGLSTGASGVRRIGLLVAESYVFSGVITIGTKSLVGRWRPYTGHGSLAFLPLTVGPNDHLSFPSGHATIAFALSSVMACQFKNRLWQVFWYACAAVTALSRVYHDQHWLSDVLLSALIGTTVGVWLNNHHVKKETLEGSKSRQVLSPEDEAEIHA